MKTTTTKLATYLVCVTVGMALIVSGISWLSLFGCAIVLSALFFSRRLSIRRPFTRWLGYIGLFASFFGGISQFIQTERYGHILLRVPPHWSFVVFIAAVWLSLIVAEFWQGSGWQASLHGWTIRRLRAMSPEKREKFLAQFDQKTQETYRKEIQTHAA